MFTFHGHFDFKARSSTVPDPVSMVGQAWCSHALAFLLDGGSRHHRLKHTLQRDFPKEHFPDCFQSGRNDGDKCAHRCGSVCWGLGVGFFFSLFTFTDTTWVYLVITFTVGKSNLSMRHLESSLSPSLSLPIKPLPFAVHKAVPILILLFSFSLSLPSLLLLPSNFLFEQFLSISQYLLCVLVLIYILFLTLERSCKIYMCV